MTPTTAEVWAVALDRSACDACGGWGVVPWTVSTMAGPDADRCTACHGSGVAGDLDPRTLARLQRWAERHPQGRALVAAALPGARVATGWDDDDNQSSRYGYDGRVVANVDWSHRSTVCLAHVMGLPREPIEGIDDARAWCDGQLRAAGWALSGAVYVPARELAPEHGITWGVDYGQPEAPEPVCPLGPHPYGGRCRICP
jgi:hypothetical protein